MLADGRFYRGYWGLGANKHRHNTIVKVGPCLNGGSLNLTPATFASLLLSSLAIVVPFSGWMVRRHSASIVALPQWNRYTTQKPKCGINQISWFFSLDGGFSCSWGRGSLRPRCPHKAHPVLFCLGYLKKFLDEELVEFQIGFPTNNSLSVDALNVKSSFHLCLQATATAHFTQHGIATGRVRLGDPQLTSYLDGLPLSVEEGWSWRSFSLWHMSPAASLNLSLMNLSLPLQVAVCPQSCLSWSSPVTWSRWGTARSCWTVGCRARIPSWSPGVKTAYLSPPARGSGSWRTVLCSSRASRNAERGARRTWASTSVQPRIAMACWSAAKPKCCWHVSVTKHPAFHATRGAEWKYHTGWKELTCAERVHHWMNGWWRQPEMGIVASASDKYICFCSVTERAAAHLTGCTISWYSDWAEQIHGMEMAIPISENNHNHKLFNAFNCKKSQLGIEQQDPAGLSSRKHMCSQINDVFFLYLCCCL